MFIIEDIIEEKIEDFVIIKHSDYVFHEAHSLGNTRIYVENPNGRDYKLVKIKNSDYKPEYFKKRWADQTCFFEYETYDENEIGSLYLEYLKQFDAVTIENISEYAVVLAGLIIKHTDAVVYCCDERLRWFVPDGERLQYVSETLELDFSGKNVLRISKLEKDINLDTAHKDMGPIGAFHNVFFMQGNGCFDMSKKRYAEIILDEQAGLGSILNNMSRYSQAFESLGLKMVSRQEKIGRFETKFLNDILRFDVSVKDANNDNTLLLKETAPYVATWFLLKFAPKIDKDILNRVFKGQLSEYASAVINGRKFLGVLIRGTDYLLVNAGTERQMATVDEIIPVVDKCMEENNYDAIYLATEDADILKKMRDYYGNKLYSNAQVRHTLAELKGERLLSDLEEDYRDNTVNYIYTLYMLASCDSFICSGYCNGYDLACALNEGEFANILMFKNGEWIKMRHIL